MERTLLHLLYVPPYPVGNNQISPSYGFSNFPQFPSVGNQQYEHRNSEHSPMANIQPYMMPDYTNYAPFQQHETEHAEQLDYQESHAEVMQGYTGERCNYADINEAQQSTVEPVLKGKHCGPKIFVGNLTSTTTRYDLLQHFQRYAVVENVHIAKDRATNLSKRFGFISFDNAEAAKCVLSRPVHLINGNQVTVRESSEKMIVSCTSNISTHDIKEYFNQFGIVLNVSSLYVIEHQIEYRCIITFESDEIANWLQGTEHFIKRACVLVLSPKMNAEYLNDIESECTASRYQKELNVMF